jgi:voltage-gated potassium channel
LTFIILTDFVFRFLSAGAKNIISSLTGGWVDLLASDPFLRFLWQFRIFKAYRLLKKYGARNICT